MFTTKLPNKLLTGAFGAGLIALGVAIGASLPNADAPEKPEEKEMPAIKDDYKKHLKAHLETEYKVTKNEAGSEYVHGSLAPIASRIMGTWVADRELTLHTGNRFRFPNAKMTLSPSKAPSELLLSAIKKRADDLYERRIKGKEKPEWKMLRKHAAIKQSSKRVIQWGEMELDFGPGMQLKSPFVVVNHGDANVIVHFKNEAQTSIDEGYLSLRHTKGGKLDSLGIGEGDEINIVFIRASSVEKYEALRSGKEPAHGSRKTSSEKSGSFPNRRPIRPMKTARE